MKFFSLQVELFSEPYTPVDLYELLKFFYDRKIRYSAYSFYFVSSTKVSRSKILIQCTGSFSRRVYMKTYERTVIWIYLYLRFAFTVGQIGHAKRSELFWKFLQLRINYATFWRHFSRSLSLPMCIYYLPTAKGCKLCTVNDFPDSD